jgi:hypothetical protein
VQIERVVDQRARLANVDGGLHLVAGEHPHLDAGATQARDGLRAMRTRQMKAKKSRD